MLRLLVSGSNGFVGSNLIEYFRGHNILIQPLMRSDFKKNLIQPALDKVNVIIHLAGKAHDLKNDSLPDEYYETNFNLTKVLYNDFLKSKALKFIFISSTKASADSVDGSLIESDVPNPKTHYGISKLLAEEYIQHQVLPEGKTFYILRPCMIHGPANKGNLNMLYNLISKGFPWPLGKFENSRSYCSIENLCFIIKELIERDDIPSGLYNVADDVPLSTNEVVQLIAESKGKQPRIIKLSKPFITTLARVGDLLKLPLNSERLQKLTDSYVVSNTKIKLAIGKPLPVSSKEGLIRTFQSFSSNV